MNIHRARSSITKIALMTVGFFIVAAMHAAAQQTTPQARETNAVSMEDSATGQGISWWVVGTGGVLNSGNDHGDILSATVGQTAIDMAGYPSTGTQHPAVAAYLGYWLPMPGSEPEPLQPTTGSDAMFALANHPNPFNNLTTISYLLPTGGQARLRVYDMTGRQVRLLLDAEQPAGAHQIIWDGLDDGGGVLSTGAYFYTLELNSSTAETDNLTVAPAHSVMYLVK
jgi:hypothetical protein